MVLVIVATGVLLFLLIAWSVHINMVRDSSHEYGWASYKKFKKQFDKYDWYADSYNSFGLWNRKEGCQFHADIVKFGNKGMVLNNPISWIMARVYAQKYYNKHFNYKHKKPKRNVVKW